MSKDTSTAVVARVEQAPLPAHITNPAPLPEHMAPYLNLRAWFDSLANKTPYTELDPEYMAQRMLMSTLLSASPDKVMAPPEEIGLQNYVEDVPGATTGPITIVDIYVAASDQEDGNPCYMMLTWVNDIDGQRITRSTGATHLQAQFCTLLAMGVYPLKGQIKRGKKTDRGGRYLFSFMPA